MSDPNQSPPLLTFLRWSARVWSVVVLVSMLWVTFTLSQNIGQPILLAFSWLVVLGLMIAWRWEGIGGALAAAAVVGYNLAYYFMRGSWFFTQPSGIIMNLYMLIPAAIFLLCWALCLRETGETSGLTASG